MEGCEVEWREEGHIKGINQLHNFGSTWVIFHSSHIAEHLVCNTLSLCHLLPFQLACCPLHYVTNTISFRAVTEVPLHPSA